MSVYLLSKIVILYKNITIKQQESENILEFVK